MEEFSKKGDDLNAINVYLQAKVQKQLNW